MPRELSRRAAPVPEDEVLAVLDAAEQDPTSFGARDGCIIALIWFCGLNMSELLSATPVDVCSVGHCCANLGKARTLPEIADRAVKRWLKVRGSHDGPLINAIARPSRIMYRSLDPASVALLIAKRARQAGLAPFAADDLARTRMVMAGGLWTKHRGALAPPQPPQTVTAGISQMATVRFLARFSFGKRERLNQRLEALARHLSRGRQSAYTFDWCTISPEVMPKGWNEAAGVPLRAAMITQSTVLGILNEAGQIERARALSATWKIIRPSPSQQRSDVSADAIGRLLVAAFEHPSARVCRDGVLMGLIWETCLSLPKLLKITWNDLKPGFQCVHRDGADPSCLIGQVRKLLGRWSVYCPNSSNYIGLTIDERLSNQHVLAPNSAGEALKKFLKDAGLAGITAEDVRYSSLRRTGKLAL